MIYLIIDTNIWIYLANGFIAAKGEFGDNLHFMLLEELKKFNNNGDVFIIVNDIIIDEWNRNKRYASQRVKELQKEIRNQNSVKNIDRDPSLELIKSKRIEQLKDEVILNKKHIEQVESFLYDDCLKVDILDKTKIDIFDMSILKKAPFHNTKNNTADAAILFSAYEYLKRYKNNYQHQNSFIFVSNNFKEFADNKNHDEFHPDIKEALISIDIQYSRELPNALKISHRILVEMKAYNEYLEWRETVRFTCITPYCESKEYFEPWGYLDGKILVKHEERNDPNQMELFPNLPKKEQKETSTPIGECVVCETTHLICPVCHEFIFVDCFEENRFECSECNSKFEFIHDNSSYGKSLIIKDNNTKTKRIYTI